MTPEFKRLESWEKKLYRRMQQTYARNLKAVSKEIASYYQMYGVKNVIEYRRLLEKLSPAELDLLKRDWAAFLERYPQYAHLSDVSATAYKINRLEALESQIKLNQYRQGMIEKDLYELHLQDVARLGYESAKKGAFISNQTVKMIANTMYVPDMDIAATILGKKAVHAQKLWRAVKDGFIRGDSYDRMAKSIEDRFGINYRDAKQWVYTEGSRCINEGKAQGFRDMGYTHYQFSTMADNRVCPTCEALDGEIFALADRLPGDNFPPMHANCRCSFEIINYDPELDG